jgi:predicted transcriptional regulator
MRRNSQPTTRLQCQRPPIGSSLTTQIAAAYVGGNAVDAAGVPGLMRDIHRSLTGLERDRSGEVPEKVRPAKRWPAAQPAIDIRESVFAGHLVCPEDGKTFRTLTRHLGEIHRMTPAQYRAKWDLPENYPMIAPDYAKLRSKLFKEIGLGKRQRLRNTSNRQWCEAFGQTAPLARVVLSTFEQNNPPRRGPRARSSRGHRKRRDNNAHLLSHDFGALPGRRHHLTSFWFRYRIIDSFGGVLAFV